MAQYQTKRAKRQAEATRKEIKDLRAEHEALEFIRNCGHVFDALMFYSGQSHLRDSDREQIRLCMTFLSRGGGT